MVQALVDLKAEVNQANEDGCTPPYIASQEGREQVVRALVNLKAGLNQATKDGSTALHFASLEGHEQMVRALVDLKAWVNQADVNGWTQPKPMGDRGKPHPGPIAGIHKRLHCSSRATTTVTAASRSLRLGSPQTTAAAN